MRKINFFFIGIVLLLNSCSTDDSDITTEENDIFKDKTEISASVPETANSIPKKIDSLESDKLSLIRLAEKNLLLQKLNWSLETEISEWERIKIHKDRISELDLSWISLQEFPKEIENLKGLENLYLNNTKIKDTVPSFLGNLPKLRLLNLADNKLNFISEEIADAQKLRILLLQNNELDSIPLEIGKLNLLIFSIKNNPMVQLPSEICEAFDFENANFSKDNIVVCEKKIIEEEKSDSEQEEELEEVDEL